MKKGLFSVLFLFAFIVFAFIVACDDSDDNSKKSTSIKIVQSTLGEGQWRIIYFFDSGSDETADFNGYIFEFDSDNLITATNGSNNYSGTWSITRNDSSGDDSDDYYDDVDFNVAFTGPPDFEELSEDWEMIFLSNAKLELRNVSGGNGGTELVTFERI